MRTDALPKLSSKAVSAHIDALSRQPFRALLTRLLECEPDPEKVKAYAEKYPDKWGQLVTMVARLGGYNERLQVETSHFAAFAAMSDSQLNARLLDRLQQLGVDPQAFRLALPQEDGVPEMPKGGPWTTSNVGGPAGDSAYSHPTACRRWRRQGPVVSCRHGTRLRPEDAEAFKLLDWR